MKFKRRSRKGNNRADLRGNDVQMAGGGQSEKRIMIGNLVHAATRAVMVYSTFGLFHGLRNGMQIVAGGNHGK